MPKQPTFPIRDPEAFKRALQVAMLAQANVLPELPTLHPFTRGGAKQQIRVIMRWPLPGAPRGAQSAFAQFLGVHRSDLSRWLQGSTKRVPARMVHQLRRLKPRLPPWVALDLENSLEHPSQRLYRRFLRQELDEWWQAELKQMPPAAAALEDMSPGVRDALRRFERECERRSTPPLRRKWAVRRIVAAIGAHRSPHGFDRSLDDLSRQDGRRAALLDVRIARLLVERELLRIPADAPDRLTGLARELVDQAPSVFRVPGR